MQMSISSASEIIPLVLEIVKPISVIDLGCGIGTWLSVWENFGITDVIGVDGEYVNKNKLLINEEKFITVDLKNGYKSNKIFDLVTCLEVAEHIDANSAEVLINSLCNLGKVILFSAAIPGQEGTQHINEQYPDYWVKIFKKNNFVPIDYLRDKIWSNVKVSSWYKQNILFYVNETYLENNVNLRVERSRTNLKFLNLVHPEYFDYKCKKVLRYEQIMDSPRLLFMKLIRSLKDKIWKKFLLFKNKIMHWL